MGTSVRFSRVLAGTPTPIKERISDPEEDRVRYPSRVWGPLNEERDPEGCSIKDNLKREIIISKSNTVLTVNTVSLSLAI